MNRLIPFFIIYLILILVIFLNQMDSSNTIPITSPRMEELQNSLQYWKHFGYFGSAIFGALAALMALISYTQTSKIEKLIRIETKKEEDEKKAKDSIEAAREREKFLNRMDIDSKERKEYEEKIQKLIEESQKLKSKELQML